MVQIEKLLAKMKPKQKQSFTRFYAVELRKLLLTNFPHLKFFPNKVFEIGDKIAIHCKL